MAIVLTNGKCFISHNEKGAVIKVSDISQAQNFHSIERAIAQKNKAPGKCAGYYFIDTDIDADAQDTKEKIVTEKMKTVKRKNKRKSFSEKERLKIYKKTKGHCYLCGEFVNFNSFEIDHRIPISKGGTNYYMNLYCSCHYCNSIKHNIYPDDFMEKITQIFMYQMERQHKGRFGWKIVHKMLNKMI